MQRVSERRGSPRGQSGSLPEILKNAKHAYGWNTGCCKMRIALWSGKKLLLNYIPTFTNTAKLLNYVNLWNEKIATESVWTVMGPALWSVGTDTKFYCTCMDKKLKLKKRTWTKVGSDRRLNESWQRWLKHSVSVVVSEHDQEQTSSTHLQTIRIYLVKRYQCS